MTKHIEKLDEGKKLLTDLKSVVGCSSEEICQIAQDLVQKYPNYYGINPSRQPQPYRKDLILTLVALGISDKNIRAITDAKRETILRYRRSMEIENAQRTKSLSEVEKQPHIKSAEIINNYNNAVAETLKSNLDTMTERLAESLDDDVKMQRTGIKDLTVALTLLSDTYRKVTNQVVKQEVQVNHNFAFPDAPEKVLTNYRPKEIVIEPSTINIGEQNDYTEE